MRPEPVRPPTRRRRKPLAAAWTQVKLRVDYGQVPDPGDELWITDEAGQPTGRRYQVLRIGGRKTLHCLVIPPDAPVGDGAQIAWRWTKRKTDV